MRTLLATVVLSFQLIAISAFAEQAKWRAGVAKINISPELPIWLSGYASRTRPATEKNDDLWAKALVLEDSAGNRAVLVTMDLVGIDRQLSQDVCARIEKDLKLPRASITLCTSHTHSGPVIRGNLMPMYDLDSDQSKRIANYKEKLADALVVVVSDAFKALAPATLSCTISRAEFAVNRRNNPEAQVPSLRQHSNLAGPSDHDLPVLAVHDLEGKLRAVVAGYACHATVLSDYFISADWPGAGQNELERRHPGTIAMFWGGCGADQNPLPRRSLEYVQDYGEQFANGVDAGLNGEMKSIEPTLRVAYEEIDLRFASMPTRAELEVEASGEKPRGSWAKYLLSEWDRQGDLNSSYPYPIQVWKLGSDTRWVFLGGEVVVDYSLRLKSKHAPKTLWVASYSNDVMGYIPSRRVLSEGGYEGGEARFPYGLPAVWSADVENQIIEAVGQLEKQAE